MDAYVGADPHPEAVREPLRRHGRKPPSACTTPPLSTAPSTEQQKAIVAATSSGSSNLRSSWLLLKMTGSLTPYRSAVASSIAVLVEPGETATAVTPVATRSAARPFTRPTTACFAAV